jgi:hypothetical protein
MPSMELMWASTIWCLWSCWLVCQYVRAPTLLTRAAAALLVVELVALLVRSFGCDQGACNLGARAAGSVATIDVPALAALLIAAATVRAWRQAVDR